MQVSITNKLLSNGAHIRKCQNSWFLALEAFISKTKSIVLVSFLWRGSHMCTNMRENWP